jgi:hypothetical protein
MTSKKDYRSTAAILADVLAQRGDRRTLRKVADGMADQYAADNLRFDRTRFLAACGLADPEPGIEPGGCQVQGVTR